MTLSLADQKMNFVRLLDETAQSERMEAALLSLANWVCLLSDMDGALFKSA